MKRKRMTRDSAEDLSLDLWAAGERLRAASRPVPRDPAFTARLRAELLLAHQARSTRPPRRRLPRRSWRLVLLAAVLAGGSGVGVAAARILAPSPPPGTILVGSAPILRTVYVGQDPRAVAVALHTGRTFVATSGDLIRGQFPVLTVRVLDTVTGALLRTVPVASGRAVTSVAMAVDVHTGHVFVVYTGTPGARLVSMLDARSGGLLRQTALPHRSPLSVGAGIGMSLLPAAIAVDARIGRVFVTNPASDTVNVLDTHSGALLRTLALGPAPTALAVDAPAGHVFVATGLDRTVRMLDAASGRVLRTVRLGFYPNAVVVDAGTGRAFVTTRNTMDSRGHPTGTGRVALLDARSGRLLRTTPVAGTLAGIAVAERADHVFVLSATGAGQGIISMLDAASGRVLYTTPLGRYPQGVTVVERTGRVVVTTDARPDLGATGIVSLLDARSGRVLHTVRTSLNLLTPGPMAVDEQTGEVFIANKYSTIVTIVDATR